jgi:ADP-heptose:LPS heptosyltransferase
VSNPNSLEQRSRRIVLTLLRAAAGRPRHDAKLKPEDLRRVLLIRYDRIGDAVITMPVIDALKRIAPDVEIDVLASPANAVVFRSDPRVHDVLLWKKSWTRRLRIIRRCRSRHYDAVLQLILGRTTLPSILAGALAPDGRTIGKSAPGRERLLDHAADLPHQHFTDRTLGVIAAGIDIDGFDLSEVSPALPISDADHAEAVRRLSERGIQPHRFILLNISAGTRDRELSDEQNIQLAAMLAATGLDVVISSAPDAVDRAKGIAAAAGAGVHAIFTGSFMQAAALIESSLLVVTPDTSIVHVASATLRPTVAMYPSSGDPTGWGPRGVSHQIVRTEGETLRQIDVRSVAAAAERIMNYEL